MIRLAYYWTSYRLDDYVRAIGTWEKAENAFDHVLFTCRQAANCRLTQWFPSAFAPDDLVRKMGYDWNPSFDFAVITEVVSNSPIGYLMRSPTQTLDLEESHD